MFKIINSLLGHTVDNQLPNLPDTDLPDLPDLPETDLPTIVASLFENKVSKLISTLPIINPSYNQLPNGSSIPNIDQFLPPTISDLSSLLKSSKKSSPNDPIPFEVFSRISPHLHKLHLLFYIPIFCNWFRTSHTETGLYHPPS